MLARDTTHAHVPMKELLVVAEQAGELDEVPNVPSSFRDLSFSLRQMILEGDLTPGEVIKMEPLCARFGVSRTPLRESLRMLQREGLVIVESSGRTRVAPVSASDAEAICVARISLDCTILRASSARTRQRAIANMVGLDAKITHFMEMGDADGFQAPHRSFHEELLLDAPERIRELSSQLSDHYERYRRLCAQRDSGIWQQRIHEHTDILSALKADDLNLAVKLLARHYATSALIVVAELDPTYEPRLLRETLSNVESSL